MAEVTTGARAIVQVLGSDGLPKPVGIFNSCRWGLRYGVQPIYALGSYAPVDQVYTDQEPVHVTASGWRVVGSGAHELGLVPRLQDLLEFGSMTFIITDRKPTASSPLGTTLCKIRNVKPLGYSTGVVARTPSEISFDFQGIYCDEKDGKTEVTNNESSSSPSFP